MKQIAPDLPVEANGPATFGLADNGMSRPGGKIGVAVLTGGSDRPYVYGLVTELLSKSATLDLIGSDELDLPEFRDRPHLHFLNLRGDQSSEVGLWNKIARISKYYLRLIRYAATAEPKIFHILWNNKFETLDRTLLMLYYRFLGKCIVLTAHNVNMAKRDSQDTLLNRITLRIQYRLAHHIFVHTEKMKDELKDEFGVQETHVTVIPFGINNSVPNTNLTPREAKKLLGIAEGEKAILFFGRITPYKGLEYLVKAFQQLCDEGENCKLIIAGRPDCSEQYWNALQETIWQSLQQDRVLLRSEFIPNEQTEIFFKAADILVLPYREIYQSGVLFLGHSFGLPVLAADVGSLSEDIAEGETGFVFKAQDVPNLTKTLKRYFASDLFRELKGRRENIRAHAMERHSWDVVGQKTIRKYQDLLEK